MDNSKEQPMDKNSCYKNEFGDTIFYDGSFFDKGGIRHQYILSMNDKYIKTFSSLNLAKGRANKDRSAKTKWSKQEHK